MTPEEFIKLDFDAQLIEFEQFKTSVVTNFIDTAIWKAQLVTGIKNYNPNAVIFLFDHKNEKDIIDGLLKFMQNYRSQIKTIV